MMNHGPERAFFEGEGEVRALLRAADWQASPLGPPETWPPELLTVVELMLHARYPAVVVWGVDAIMLYNDAYTYMLGQRHPGALGLPFREVWPEIWADIKPIVDAAMAGVPAYFTDVPVTIAPHGVPEQRWFTSSYSPVTDREGKVLGMFNAGFETTARILNEKRLRFQLQLSDALRHLGDPEVIIGTASEMLGRELGVARVTYAEIDDRSGGFLIRHDWISGALPSIAGLRGPLDAFGPDIVALLRADQPMVVADVGQDPRTAGCAAYAEAGVRANLAIPLVKDGRLALVLSVQSATPFLWQEEHVRLAHDTAQRTWDAVERSLAEKIARDQQEQLRQADIRKDEFLAMLAHELRNPLAPIGAAADLLQMAPANEAGVRKSSQVIARQVRHMTSLVDDLLDVSRVTRGLIELERAPADLRHILMEAVEQVTPLLQARRHRLATELHPEHIAVNGDRKRLVQVFVNILNNAAKYTQAEGEITLKSEVRGQQVAVHICDNGIGMTPQLAARAFDLFAQAERTPDRSSGGLGLGLALVKDLVELHGGTVSCASPGVGKGSTFSVRLPVLPDPHGLAEDRHGAPAPDRTVRPLRVMIVDDNADAASLLAILLEATGHEVRVEHDSAQVPEDARRAPPDVFLLDIGLPGMDGNELARRLRAQPETAGAVMIAVTGYGQAEDRRQTAAAGFDHHLVKPLDIHELTRLLDDLPRTSIPPRTRLRPRKGPG